MTKFLIAGSFVVLATAGHANDPKLLGCYERVLVPAEYNTKKIKIKDARQVYIKRKNRIELVEYAPVYREEKTLVKKEYYVMREISCN